jgi:hypothetical protein
MSLRNQCTFSICAICGTLRLVVADSNRLRLGASNEIASKRIRHWQEAQKPPGARVLLGRDEDESEVLLVCQPCLDLVAQVDAVDVKLRTLFESLWDRMQITVVNQLPKAKATPPVPGLREFKIVARNGFGVASPPAAVPTVNPPELLLPPKLDPPGLKATSVNPNVFSVTLPKSTQNGFDGSSFIPNMLRMKSPESTQNGVEGFDKTQNHLPCPGVKSLPSFTAECQEDREVRINTALLA